MGYGQKCEVRPYFLIPETLINNGNNRDSLGSSCPCYLSRSGCQAKIPWASPFSIRSNISPNTVQPGSLTVFASLSEATISSFSLTANSYSPNVLGTAKAGV